MVNLVFNCLFSLDFIEIVEEECLEDYLLEAQTSKRGIEDNNNTERKKFKSSISSGKSNKI